MNNMRSAFGLPKHGNLSVVQSRAAIGAQQRRKKHFVILPMEWIDRLEHARHVSTFKVAHELLYRRWKTGQQSVQTPAWLVFHVGEVAGVIRARALRADRDRKTAPEVAQNHNFKFGRRCSLATKSCRTKAHTVLVYS